MRILYHHRTLAEGAEGVHIRAMVQALRALGHDVRVEALVGDPELAGNPAQPRWASLRRLIPAPAYELAELAYNAVARRRLDRAIAEFQPELVYDRYNSYSSAAVDAARRRGLPSILEVNAPVVFERTAYENLPLRWPALARRHERRILFAASHLCVVSTPLADYLASEHGVARERISVLPNGVDPVRFRAGAGAGAGALRARMDLPPGALVIGFSGLARPWHGVELLVEAMARLLPAAPHLHLLVVGGGPSVPMLRALARSRGIEARTRFVEAVPHDEMPAWLEAMDIAVSPRATFYASPLKIVEYMAMGRAIVAPAMRNVQDLLADGDEALLFEPENVEALAAALARLAASPALRDTLGRQARRAVDRDRHWAANARHVTELAHRLLAAAAEGTSAPARDTPAPAWHATMSPALTPARER